MVDEEFPEEFLLNYFIALKSGVSRIAKLGQLLNVSIDGSFCFQSDRIIKTTILLFFQAKLLFLADLIF